MNAGTEAEPVEQPAPHDGRNNPAPTPTPPYQATPALNESDDQQ